eukprot:m51a1_g4068 putative sh3 domain containing protein (284) ;mRNA; r:752615-754072
MADTNLLVQGFLTKQGNLHRSWKKRWFCNTTDELFILKYYTDESCSNKKGQIDLREVFNFRTKADTKERGPKQRVGFALVTPGRTWKLIAVGSSSGDYWSSGLDRLIAKARQAQSSQPQMVAPAVATAPSVAVTQSAVNAAPAPLKAPPALTSPRKCEGDEKIDQELADDLALAPGAEGEDKRASVPAAAATTTAVPAQTASTTAAAPASAPAPAQDPSKRSSKPRITATAQYSYTAANPNELSFEVGDKLVVLQRDDEAGWWAAELNGKRGWVSSFYLQIDE